jgi:hypothetical protein
MVFEYIWEIDVETIRFIEWVQGRNMNGSKNLGNKNWVVWLGILGTILTIITFLSGKNFPDFFTARSQETETPTHVIMPEVSSTSTLRKVSSTPLDRTVIVGTSTADLVIAPTGTSKQPTWGSDLVVRKPTLNEIRENMVSIWDANLLSVKDIQSPSAIYYQGEAKVGHEYLWTWHWCTTTKEILQNNRLSMTVHFYVNGNVLPSDDKGPVFVYDYDLVPTNTPCAYWSTVIKGVQENQDYELIITYTFSENVNDGSYIYPRGEYKQVLNLTTK